jgi:hypothetical protein
MAIAGIIEPTSAITLPRVLERIFDHEQPGLLRLRHLPSGKTARVKIDHGTIQETIFGELRGDAAMQEISATFPWEYEFISQDQAITMARSPQQLERQPGKRPALKLSGAAKPTLLHSGRFTDGFAASTPAAETSLTAAKPERKSAFMTAKPAVTRTAASAGSTMPVVDGGAETVDPFIPAAPNRRMKQWPDAQSLSDWVESGDEYSLRFARSGETVLGKVSPDEWAYFGADSASLMLWAAGIGETLGYSAPVLAALVEPQRAACYRRLKDGFAGIYSGPETTVDAIIDIP